MSWKTVCLAAAAAGVLAVQAGAAAPVTGDYVESRSANVYVGACHHEGEITTAGRNAVMAWRVDSGEFRGVSLKGIQAVAVVAADRNLSLEGARRRSVLYVSETASPEQRDAFVALLKERAGPALGEMVAVKTAPVSFRGDSKAYAVEVKGVASMQAAKTPGQLCCKQPYEVWGKPLVPLAKTSVGYCVQTQYDDRGLLQAWKATDQNNVFWGEFRL